MEMVLTGCFRFFKNKWIANLLMQLLLILSASFAAEQKELMQYKIDSSQYSQALGDTVSQPGSNIMVVFQDSKYRYWFGSWETGLYTFDGKTIVNFTTKHGLPGNRIEEIREDKFGNIFINTNAGLCKYDGREIISIPEPINYTSQWNLQPDDLWFKSRKMGYVNRYDGKFLHTLKVPKSIVGEEYLKSHPNAYDPYGIYYIYRDSKGHIWFGMSLLGTFRYDGKTFDWISEPDLTELHGGPANGVRSIIEDREGYFWFNSEYRYKVLDRKTIGTEPFYEKHKSIGSLDGNKAGNMNEYLSITKDNDNNLWIATYRNGVWKYDGKEIRHYSIQENGKDINLFYIYNDKIGNIWLGTHQNGIWKLKEEVFKKL